MSYLERLQSPLWLVGKWLWKVWGQLDDSLVRLADFFGVRVVNPLYRYLTIQVIFLVIYGIGVLPIPVVPLLALTWGYVGVLAIGRAWVKNEKLRTSIAKKVVEIDPDSLPDFRLSALLAAVQLLVLFPMIFYQTYRTFGLYQLAPDEKVTAWSWLAFTIDSYNKAFLGILDLYGILHNPKITPISVWGKNLMLLARVTFDWQLIQGGFRLLSIRETIRDAVTAIVRDPSMALAVGRRTVAPLISALEQDEPIIRIRAADVLGQLKDPDAIEPLIEVLKLDESPEVRAAAARSLGMLRAVEAKDALLAALNDSAGEVGAAAAEALGRLGEAGETIDALLAALADSDPTKRGHAGQALAELADPRAVDTLVEMSLFDPEDSVRQSMVEALKLRWSDLAGDRFIRRLQDSTPQSVLSRWFGSRQAQLQADRLLLARQRAAEALGHLGHQRAVKSLMHAVQDPSRLVRRAAIEALGKLADPSSLAALLTELQDRERDVRAAAAQAISLLGQTKAVDPLIHAWRKESEGEVRHHLGQAIMKLDPNAAEAAGIT